MNDFKEKIETDENDTIVIKMGNEEPKDNRLDSISDKNEVIASGAIVHKFDTPKSSLITLVVRGGNRLDIYNYPQFLLTGEAKEAAKDFKTGDHVQIKGYCMTFLNKKGDTAEYEDVIMGYAIERTKSRLAKLTLEQGLGSHRDIPTAEFFIAGTVVSFEIRNNSLHIVIKAVEEGKRPTYSNYYMYLNDFEKVMSILKKGKRICAVGEIQTKKIEREGEKPLYIQRNVISDISSIENVLTIK